MVLDKIDNHLENIFSPLFKIFQFLYLARLFIVLAFCTFFCKLRFLPNLFPFGIV